MLGCFLESRLLFEFCNNVIDCVFSFDLLSIFVKAKDKNIKDKNKRSSSTAGYNNGNLFFFLVINFSTTNYYL